MAVLDTRPDRPADRLAVHLLAAVEDTPALVRVEAEVGGAVEPAQGVQQHLAGVPVSDGGLVEDLGAKEGAVLPHEGGAGGRLLRDTGYALVKGRCGGACYQLAGGQEAIVVEGAQQAAAGVGEVVTALLDHTDLLAQGCRGDVSVGVHKLIHVRGAGAHSEGGAGGG